MHACTRSAKQKYGSIYIFLDENVSENGCIYIYIYIYKWFGWKVKTGLDVASRQRCFVSCLTHQEFNTKCIYNNRHFGQTV